MVTALKEKMDNFGKIKCPNCGQMVKPEIINHKGHITGCPLCGAKLSG